MRMRFSIDLSDARREQRTVPHEMLIPASPGPLLARSSRGGRVRPRPPKLLPYRSLWTRMVLESAGVDKESTDSLSVDATLSDSGIDHGNHPVRPCQHERANQRAPAHPSREVRLYV